MSLDPQLIHKIAHLARIDVPESAVSALQGDLNAILKFVEQLANVDVTDIVPMTAVVPHKLRLRKDEVTDHAGAETIVSQTEYKEDNYFVVPRVVE